ncbi:MAG: hypothetical protein NVSMB9_22410 [Isosphaeraceae bacterium]
MDDEVNANAPRCRGSTPWGFLGMLLLVVAVEGSLSRHAMKYADYLSFSWHSGSRNARGRHARADLICLGDSMVKCGVLPRLLEDRLGLSAYNFAMLGGQAPSSFFLLRRVLEAGGRPRALVVDFQSTLLMISPTMNVSYWSDLLDARDGMDLAWETGDLNLIVRTALPWLLPSLKVRDGIRADIRAALRNEGWPHLEERRSLRHSLRINAGAVVNPHATVRPTVIETNPPRRAAWTPKKVHLIYLKRFLDLAESRGIPVFWLLPPTHPDWQLRRERLGLDAPFARMIEYFQRQYRNVVVVDGRHSGYDRSRFSDEIHLNCNGAQELSQTLATLIGAHLKTPDALPRWLPLPRSQGADSGVSVEDLAESRKATDPEGRGVRR